jgi:hypothetical protein
VKRVRTVLKIVTPLLVALAVAQQVRKPAGERTWHGSLLGFVPYDFRLPTLAILRDAYWNPADHHIFTARPFGIGWAVNLHEVWRRISAGTVGGAAPAAAG